MRTDTSSWLCRDNFDRERMLDMEGRVAPVRRRAVAIVCVSIVGLSPWLGWWPALSVAGIMGAFPVAERLMPRLRRPEFLMFAAWLGSSLTIAVAVALSGGQGVAALSWLAIPVISLSSRFSIRGVVVGLCTNLVLALTVAFTVDGDAVIANPTLVVVPVVLILCVAVLSVPLMRSDIEHRSDAAVDQLTGMLNRKALGARARELAEQSAMTGEPVGMIVADLDLFKLVNDTHGHSVGDSVLREVAYAMRRQLRAFDLAYRLGGEEFLILLPGAELDAAEDLAERLRSAISGEPLAGSVPVTMSFGVAASPRGGRFDYEATFAEADAALYEAKDAGRDRVRRAGPALVHAGV